MSLHWHHSASSTWRRLYLFLDADTTWGPLGKWRQNIGKAEFTEFTPTISKTDIIRCLIHTNPLLERMFLVLWFSGIFLLVFFTQDLTWVILSTETGMPSIVRGGSSEASSPPAGACSARAFSRSSNIMPLYFLTCRADGKAIKKIISRGIFQFDSKIQVTLADRIKNEN